MKRSEVVWFALGVLVLGGGFVAALVALDAGVGWVARQLAGVAPVLLLVVAAVLVLGRRRRFGGAMAGRMVSVRGHAHGLHDGGGRHRASRHEAGHAAAARRVGRLHSAEVYADGTGLVQATVPDAESAVVFLLAGQVAHGSRAGAGADDALIKKTLQEFPAAERAAVRRRALVTARQICSRESGRIRRDARTLDREGRLSR